MYPFFKTSPQICIKKGYKLPDQPLFNNCLHSVRQKVINWEFFWSSVFEKKKYNYISPNE